MGVFDELKILELGAGAAGPVAARYFTEQGARVIRIESATHPDFLRLLNHTPDSPHGLNGGPMFTLLNPEKESVAVDLKRPEGIAIVEKLVAWADVVSENFSPGVMERFGLGWERLREIRPDLIMVSNCLFGQTGPQRHYPGFGGQASAISGFNQVAGWPDREATGPFGTITDSLSPRYVALAITAALLHRRRTGRGQLIDVSQIEVGVYSLSELIVRRSANGEIVTRDGNRDDRAAPHGTYPCEGDDRWIAIAVFTDAQWAALAQVAGDPEWTRDARFASAAGRLEHRDALDEHLATWTSTCDAYELMGRLQDAGVEAGVVQAEPDLLRDPQLAHRGHFCELTHRHLGPMQFEHSAVRLGESAPVLDRPAPDLGEHSESVLREVLGLEAEEIRLLLDAQILR